jgi:hypothetical protein
MTFAAHPDLRVPDPAVLDQARKLAPAIAADGEACEQLGTMPPAIVDALRESGLFDIMVPREQIRERFPVEAATTRVALGQVVFLDGVRAAVQFELLRKGSFSLGPQVGYAVRERDGWKVARDTYTRVIGMAGIPIPPPPPPPSLQDMTRPAED